ncbi:MAG: SdrD B-like domain-containing protein, partial [Kordia sp.]|uniref:SdrD B-like domain-containing protein n=1 Tax=Kordia sp. TaxID=1965332 RepID=UPI00385AD1CA
VDFGINEQQVVNFNVSGNVFDDDNANGAADAGEVALEGVLITLYADNNADGALDAGDTVISTTNSVANGNYNFANVTVENVVLAITIPTDTADFTYTLTTAATLAASSTTTDVTGLDFGIDKLQIIDYNISGTVFNDINTNGTNDTEAGLDAITVKLYSDNDASGTLTAGDGLLQIGSTGVNGTYSFTNVTTEYTLVGVEVPGNTPAFTYTATTPVKVGVSSTITDVNDVDFGIFKDEVIDFNISGTVFEDEDSNGIIDTTELGRFDNVTMMLYRDNNEDGAFDTGDTMITSTTTGVDGTYSFSNVTDKNTLVMSSTPANTPEFIYTSTTPELVAVMSTIADVNDVDYGVNITTIIDYNISGTVFDDDNNSGDINPSEGRIQNVVVRLYEDMNEDGLLDANDNQIANRATGSNGEYQFNNVTTRKTLVEFRIPGNSPNFTYTATTPDVVAVEGTTTDITNVNFGINEEQVIDYNISGTVFDDNNENGTIDAGDGVLDGINITLYADNNADGVLDVADTTLTSTSTDVNGAYSFSNITTENVLAIVTVPGNTATFTYVLTTSNTQAVSSLITDVNGLDFGINENLVIDYNISGTVFDDDNANGAEDAGEPALENVTLSLYADNNADGTVDAGDTVITTTTSATDGTYSFLNVTVQNTVVEVTVPTNNGTFTYVLTTSGSVNTSSTINDVNNVDFGINREEVILYDISGTVFDDDDSSGVQDAGEGFVAGVTVTLYADNDGNGILDATDTVITTTTSDATAGDYIFTGVTERNTIVEVTVPTSTGAFTYTLTTAATQSVSSTITNVIDVDFGIDEFEIINYSIFGTVYDDDNENAALDATEAGRLENITLTLYVDEDGDGRLGDDDTIIQTTTTAADGTYSFLNITIRNTVTAITVPENTAEYTYTLTTAARLTNSSVSTDIFNVDFGVNKVATSYVVSGNVFNDENADGTNATTEAGLRGVTVNLFDDVNGNGRIDRGEPLIDTASSDRSGNYQFLGITAPNVIVQVVVPASTSQFMYNPTTPVIVVLSGGVSTTVDFGIQRIIVILYNVSGIVWDDQNSDQIIDGNEGRLSGIGVTLFNDANANGILDAGDNAVSTIPTSTNGDYLFTNVTFRNIIIAPAAPADGVFTTPSNRAVSSVNTDVVDVNFGVRVPSTLFQVTGVVFDDQNENGIADPGEASLNGLPVEIYADTDGDGFFDPNLDALVAFTQTSNGGFGFLDPNYLVDDIPPGLVHIVLTLPDDTIFETYRNTYDPDSGTASPDGVYTVNMNNDLFNIDFGVKRTDATSTSRADSGDVLFTNGNAINAAPEDVSERLRLYPNPTVNQIAINASEFAGDVTVEIYNDRGYRLMSTTVSAFGSEYKVDVQRLAPGMYYAKFASNNKVASKKFVKK